MLLPFIILYLVATVLIGWWAGRNVKTTRDYVLAGKNLPMMVVACALFATWFGSETVMGASSEFAEKGLIGVIEDPFGAALCLFLCGLLIARPLYKLDLLTFSDYFRIRFGKRAELVSAVFNTLSYFGWIAAQIVALAVVMQAVTGMEREWGVFLCTSLVLLYTYVGGMWSVAITDFVQTIMIIVGLLALTVSMVMQVGGFGSMIAQAPEGFFRFLPEPKPLDMINWFAAWITIGLGSIPQQDVFQRVMGAKSERSSILACYISAFMYLSIAFMPIIIAFCARLLHPELMEGDLQMLIPTMVLKYNGIGMQILFFGALLSAILSTCSGALLAPATVIGENLIRPLQPGLSDAALLRIMRWSVLGVAVVTGGMALSRDNIYELVSESSALSLVSLFVPLIAGLYWKKANTTGAISAMVFGMIVWLLTLWLLPGENEIPPSNIWLGIPPMIYGFVASILAMFAGSIIGAPRKA